MMKALVKLVALAALSLATPAVAQINAVDPDTNQAWRQQPPPPGTPSDEVLPDADLSVETPLPVDPPPSPDWTPIEQPAGQTAAPQPDVRTGTTPAAAPGSPTAAAEAIPREDVFDAATGVFGRGAEGLAGILEDILRDQGEPIAYIAGEEAGGAFVVGLRYGSGVMRHRTAGDQVVYWTGPSVGFDFGADASKVFILVYNLSDAQQIFRRYPGGEGRAYFVGGFTATYLRRGDVVLIPVRLGVGLRLGINAGYLRFSERNRWFPF